MNEYVGFVGNGGCIMETIKIKYHVDGVNHLEKIKIGDWIDLRAAENAFIPYGEFKLISLGVSMKLPEGYEAHVVPRSSTFKRWGIIQTNSMGVIDNSYSGTNDIWKFPALCLGRKTGAVIHTGDRICQFRIMPIQPKINFEAVDVLDETDRGGFGTSGKN